MQGDGYTLQVPPPDVTHPGGEGGVMHLVPGKSVALPPEVRDSQHLEIEAIVMSFRKSVWHLVPGKSVALPPE
eukprot:1160751-Pelagomonas_calceolata.AAC.1